MRKTLIGEVVSTKMQKTVTVVVQRKFKHSRYKKVITRHKRYKVHNEKLKLEVGDRVSIRETRPISKDKYFTVVEKISEKK